MLTCSGKAQINIAIAAKSQNQHQQIADMVPYNMTVSVSNIFDSGLGAILKHAK